VLPIMEKLGKDYMPDSVRNLEAFRPALAWVMSRGLQGSLCYEYGKTCICPTLSADAPRSEAVGPFFAPLFDLLNHTSVEAERCTKLARGENQTLEIHAHRDLEAGEEILWSYGPHPTSELLRTYGFVEHVWNPHSGLMFSLDEIKAGFLKVATLYGRKPKNFKARLTALEEANRLPPAVTVFCAEEPGEMVLPEQLLTMLQVLAMTLAEYKEWVKGGCCELGQEFLDEGSLPVVCGALLAISASKSTRLDEAAEKATAAAATAAATAAVSPTQAANLASELRDHEKQLLVALKKAVVKLTVAEEDVEEEGEEEELQSDPEQEVDDAEEAQEEEKTEEAASSSAKRQRVA